VGNKFFNCIFKIHVYTIWVQKLKQIKTKNMAKRSKKVQIYINLKISQRLVI